MRLRLSRKKGEWLTAVLFLAPNLTGFLLFTSLPVLAALALSATKWDMLTPPRFVGLDNFIRLLGFHQTENGLVANDPLFWKFLFNTLFFMLAIPFNMLGSLVLAMGMNQKLRGVVGYRTIFFISAICPGVAVCILWRWMFHTDFGLINNYIAAVGSTFGFEWHGPGWLTDPAWAKPALMIMGFWVAVGGTNMILYLAALQGIPQGLYEAASIDGAGAWQKFRRITIPMVSPTTFFIGIMSIIAGFQGGFMSAYVMTQGGPNGATTTLGYYIYQNAWQWLKMGYASTVAWVLFLLILIVTMISWKYGGRRVEY